MIIHLIHHPVSAKRFVEPIVELLNDRGIQSELWVENRNGVKEFVGEISCPKRFAAFDLSLNPFVVLARVFVLFARFLRLRPDGVHAHQTRGAFIPLVAASMARIPVRIYHAHGTPYLGYRGVLRRALWLLEFLNCRLATHVLTVSHSIRDTMIRDHLAGEVKCQVLGRGSACGIDLTEFSEERFGVDQRLRARQALGILSDAYVPLYIGRPRRRKGFHTLLDAWRPLSTSGNHDVLVIAGCTQNDVIRAMGGPVDGVVALGYLKDLRACYAACDVVVLPSWHEGFPYSLMEGAAAARPLVGSDIPGIDCIVTSETGMRIPPNDVAALTQALLVLKKDRGLRKRMGEAARRYVEQSFDRREFCRSVVGYYSEIGFSGN